MTIFRETGFRVPARTRPQIRRRAQFLRDFAASEYGFVGDAFEVVRVIEKWGLMRALGDAAHPDYLVVDDRELPGRAGEFRPRDKQLDDDEHENLFVFRRSVWDAACEGDPEARETLGHELGHCMLEHPKVTLARTYSDERVQWNTDSEWQANVFMDELLMDSRLIAGSRGWGEIVRRCGVTRQSAIRHIRELMNERKGKELAGTRQRLFPRPTSPSSDDS